MAGETEVQVSHFLDEHGVGAFQIKLILWSVLIAFIDGSHIGAIAFAAPSLIKEWHIAPRSSAFSSAPSTLGCCSARRFSAGSATATAARPR